MKQRDCAITVNYLQLVEMGRNLMFGVNSNETFRATMAKEVDMLYRHYFMLLRKDGPYTLDLNKP